MTENGDRDLRFTGDLYTLIFPDDRPFVYLEDPAGNRLAELFAPASVHTTRGQDDTSCIQPWAAEASEGGAVYHLVTGSSTWRRKVAEFQCTPRRFVYRLSVEGEGRLSDTLYFGGFCSARPRWGSGFFLSAHSFVRGFNPEPDADNTPYFDPTGGQVIDLVGGPLPGRRHWFFNPPPFCFAFEVPSGWIGMGVEAAPGANRFSEYRYHAQDGFYLSLAYDGQTEVRGTYTFPAIGFDFGARPEDALQLHVSALRGARAVPAATGETFDWWRGPIFCGWGAQCHRAAADRGYRPQGPKQIDHERFLACMRYAPSYSRQDCYEEWLRVLEARRIFPATVVVDDKWQATYGGNQADPDKWPNLKRFVEERHAAGQRVLLWLKAWDPEGVPAEECVRNAAGLLLAVDPTNPAYERRLRAAVRRMVSASGYDADGFKIDFTQRIPAGPGMRLHGDAWGLELMHRYLSIIRDEAKSVKPDALIMTQTPHPYLAGVADMIRLNDMLDLTQVDDSRAGQDIADTLSLRALVARTASPDWLIDTDNWPVRNKDTWRAYLGLQREYGVPSLYFVDHIDLTGEPLDERDYALIRETWHGIDRSSRTAS